MNGLVSNKEISFFITILLSVCTMYKKMRNYFMHNLKQRLLITVFIELLWKATTCYKT